MAAATAMANRHIVSTTLHHLSDMKYKTRRQYGPDQPVEFMEFRPTLVPSILVNKLWADEGTSILWKRYPHLPALRGMDAKRRQYYANKVEQVFSLSPPLGHPETLDYLDGLEWPNLKSLELEVDFQRHGSKFASMLHARLEHVELSGCQSGGSRYFAEGVIPALMEPCENLMSLQFGPDTITGDDPVHASALFHHLDARPSINTIKLKSINFVEKDDLFIRLSQRPGFEGLEIDLDPGTSMVPLLSGPSALPSPFASLKRLWIMCYPEVALALPVHLHLIEELQFDIARMANHPVQDSDHTIFEDLIPHFSDCPRLRLLKVGVGLLAENFPSFSSFPRLTGSTLLGLAETCPKLEDLNLLATEPSAIDGTDISSEEFDNFCKTLPYLKSLNLKLHPTTTSPLQTTALQSLGQHCPELEVVRLKLPFLLPSLPVPSHIPEILISGEMTPHTSTSDEPVSPNGDANSSINKDTFSSDSGLEDKASTTDQVPPSPLTPLFPRLTHLAISRPETALASSVDAFTASSSSYSASDIVDPEIEQATVRSWAHALLAHFPHLEILEAWGDWAGQDNESLNYFLPRDEILASTWEFLSGIEQDLWEDDGELEEGDSWQTLDSGEDWDMASMMNEYPEAAHDGGAALYEDEPEGMITPGKVLDTNPLFQDPDLHAKDAL